MRLSPVVACAAVLAVVLGAVAVSARAEGEAESAAQMQLLRDQVASLKADVDALRLRDVALTEAVGRLASAANGLRDGAAATRADGFEGAAISAPSRVRLLATIEALARDLAAGTAGATREEQEAQRKADALRKVWTR